MTERSPVSSIPVSSIPVSSTPASPAALSPSLRFAELHCVSNFSFLRGASHPEELIQQAAALGYQALALTDECSVAGVVRAHQAIKDQQLAIRLIIGSEFRYHDECGESVFVVLVKNKRGYSQLCQLISRCRRAADKGQYQFHPQQLLALSDVFILAQPATLDTQEQQALIDTFFHPERQYNRYFLMAERLLDESEYAQYHQIFHWGKRLSNNKKTDESPPAKINPSANSIQILPIVAANNVHMHVSSRKSLQDCLTAIRLNSSLADVKGQLFSNAERYLRSLKKLKYLYPQTLLENSAFIADQCQFSLDEIAYSYPTDCVPPGESADQQLRGLVREGQKKRFPNGTPKDVQATIDKELALIKRKRYEHYFLTVHDIVRFARAKGIMCQGRGSAANSVVCYCLEITEVNPVEVQLLFERFISEGRDEPPDIDVDFESQRREEVIQYIYQRYGRERAALTATVITYRKKSAVRDVGKALGLDLLQLEQLIENYGWRYQGENWLDELLPSLADIQALQHQHQHQHQNQHKHQNQHQHQHQHQQKAATLDQNHVNKSHVNRSDAPPLLLLFKQLVQQILHFPRHLSQHVGGFVISQGALSDLVPIENASMAERTVIQWDKDDLESLGLMKVDVLGLGMMTAIRRSLQMLSSGTKTMTLADIPRDDAATYAMLQKADSVGVFQVESRAQMNMLPRLKPSCYYDLVVQVAIVRPGPIHGDMVHPYLKRRNGEEQPSYPMAALQPILERTLGIPLFQEQVIAFAMVAADFNAAEADQLRRSMASWKKKGHMHQLQQRLANNMKNNGFSDRYIERIQRQLQGFGEYGFPESHAASFALLVYVTAWLKCHHPAVFCCALLNSQPMGFYSPAQLIQDARQHGVTVLAVDVNHSSWDCQPQHSNPAANQQTETTEHDSQTPYNSLRLGLRLVKGLKRDSAETIVQQRPPSGYSSLQQCLQRTRLNQQQRQALASANAFASLSGHRYQARWQVADRLNEQAMQAGQAMQPGQAMQTRECVQPDLLVEANAITSDVQLAAPQEIDNLLEDYHSLGLTLGRHPIEILRQQGKLGRSISALALRQQPNNTEVYVAGLVTCRQRPGTSAGVTFVTLEDETGSINVVVWLATAKRQLKTLVQSSVLQVYGKVEKDAASGVTHIIAYRLLDLSATLK